MSAIEMTDEMQAAKLERYLSSDESRRLTRIWWKYREMNMELTGMGFLR